jgi:hypothetical protein
MQNKNNFILHEKIIQLRRLCVRVALFFHKSGSLFFKKNGPFQTALCLTVQCLDTEKPLYAKYCNKNKDRWSMLEHVK